MESTSGRGSTHSPGREASLGANGFKLGLILMILVARARECAPMAFLTAHRASGRTYAPASRHWCLRPLGASFEISAQRLVKYPRARLAAKVAPPPPARSLVRKGPQLGHAAVVEIGGRPPTRTTTPTIAG